MRYRQLKSRLTIKLVIYAITTIIILQGFYFLSQYQNKIENKNIWLRNDIRSLKNKLRNINQKSLEISKSIKIWEGLDDQQKELNGIQISKARNILNSLKEKYNIINMNVTFSKPKNIDDRLDKESISVFESKINIQIQSLTDINIYNFVSELDTLGIIQLTSFEIVKLDDLGLNKLKEIASGDEVALVKGEVEFLWYGAKSRQ